MGRKGASKSLTVKRPLNIYLEFSKDIRPRVLEELGSASTKEVASEIGKRWRNLSEEDKLAYERKYKENMRLFKLDKQAGKSPPEKGKENIVAPKKPLSCYMEFCLQERKLILEEAGTISIMDVGKELGKRWKLLSEENKEHLRAKARSNLVRYKEEMKLYKKKVKQHCTEDVMEEVNEDEPETSEASATVEESASVDEDCASEVESQTPILSSKTSFVF